MRKPVAAARSSFPTGIGLWVLSALIMLLFVIAKLAVDRFFDPTGGKPSSDPSITIHVDDPVVLKGDAAALIAFIEGAANTQGGGINLRFLGELTDLTVFFRARRFDPATGVAIDAMMVEVGPTAYVLGGEMVDQALLTKRMRNYVEAAANAGMTPVMILKVKSSVPVLRLLEFFKLSTSLGGIHFEMESVSVSSR